MGPAFETICFGEEVPAIVNFNFDTYRQVGFKVGARGRGTETVFLKHGRHLRSLPSSDEHRNPMIHGMSHQVMSCHVMVCHVISGLGENFIVN